MPASALLGTGKNSYNLYEVKKGPSWHEDTILQKNRKKMWVVGIKKGEENKEKRNICPKLLPHSTATLWLLSLLPTKL